MADLRAATRGPRRPITLTDDQVAELVDEAIAGAGEVETAQAAIRAAAARRRDAVRALSAGGLSVRQIAELLEVAPTVVADLLNPRRA